MANRWTFRLTVISALVTLAIALALVVPGVYSDGDQFTPTEKSEPAYPNLGFSLNQMVANLEAQDASSQDAAEDAKGLEGEPVAVTIYLSSNVDDVVDFLEDNGGSPRNVGDDYIEAYVPVPLLGELSEQLGVLRVQEISPPQPARVAPPVAGQGAPVHGSPAWNQAGYSGLGIKVGVIDTGFMGFGSLMGTELPDTVMARCYTDMGEHTKDPADCEAGSQHGAWVAESVIDVAPKTSLYIANPLTKGDLQDAVDWMAGEGVTVINHSVSWDLDGPGDGTSPFGDSPLKAVDQAVDAGIIWVNATSNAARKTWFGAYHDPDKDKFINFDDTDEGNTVFLNAGDVIKAQLRWDDTWDAADKDFDLYLFYVGGGSSPFSVARSLNFQTGQPGQTPYESLSYEVHTSGEYALTVYHYTLDDPEEIELADWLQLTVSVDLDSIEHYTVHHSTFNPEESANPGMLAVGAAPWYNPGVIQPYSGQGPTTDGRVKPDIVGVDCGETARIRLNEERCGFFGTSQAAAHVAGLASLVRQRFPGYTPQQVAGYLKDHADPPETHVPNNTWGYGLAQLPPPEATSPPPSTDSCVQYLDTLVSGDMVDRNGVWTDNCDSANWGGRYARFYSFTLDHEAEVRIDLTSAQDTYLFLLDGAGNDGMVLAENDDVESGNTSSQVTVTLEVGSYTVEATTYSVGQTGEFELAIHIPFAFAVMPSDDGCLTALGALGESITRYGSWTGDCASTNRRLRPGFETRAYYGRFYAFALEQRTEVQVDLESSQDTYVYLLAGTGADGMVLAENDDAADGTTDSRVTITLEAGVYTVEATTYAEEVTGAFSLSLISMGSPYVCVRDLGILRDPLLLDGAWSGECASPNRDGSYAEFYSFALDQDTEIRIDLTSAQDTYLFLLDGAGNDGMVLAENDDVESGNTSSQVTVTLEVGSYTVEATTYTPDETGDFSLRITGLEGTPGGCFQDLGPLTVEINQTGTWTGDCNSINREGSYARLYSFTLSQESEVNIDLSSSADAYLYLLEGAGPWTTALAESDDIEVGNTDSRIVFTLDAGIYTVEATTYAAGETGNFTLSIGSTGRASEREALVGLYHATGGSNWAKDDNWLSDAPVAQWHGVTVDIDGQVIGLDLSENRVTGDIPPELRLLSSLELLHLQDNRLTGRIPAWVGSLSNLQYLDLGDNRLTGEIPREMGNLVALQELLLDGNQLTGEIPYALGDLTELRQLHLNDNELTGEITFTLYKLDQLVRLNLGFNELSGEIPDWIGDFSNLITLDVGGNQLAGEIPTELGNLVNLQALHLDGNKLEGTIPPGFGNFPELRHLHLDNNRLTGEIPDSLRRLAKMDRLDLSGNRLSGTIPAWMGSYPLLLRLDLRDNRLTGEIPPELGQLSTLQDLRLEKNRLTGEIPPELGQLTELLHFHLDHNQLTGEIPDELSNLSDLFGMDFSHNQLTGLLPTWTGEFPRLVRLDLSNNQLSGEVPTELGERSDMLELLLNNNLLDGEIPTELGSLAKLMNLDLSNNQLSGEIPTELGSLPRLGELRLNSNLLEGAIPAELASLSVLKVLHLSDNRLSGEIPPALLALPRLQTTSFWGNELQGNIPLHAADRATLSGFYDATGGANWTNSANWTSDAPMFTWYGVSVSPEGRATGLSLRENELSGAIPPALGDLSSLITLDLSANQLLGVIPAELGNLSMLELLRLSDNQLTGEIPSELGDLDYLMDLQLAGNELTGCVPADLEGVADNDLDDLGLTFCDE